MIKKKRRTNAAVQKRGGKVIFAIDGDTKHEDLSKAPTDRIMNQIKESPLQFSRKTLNLIESMHFEDYLKELMEKHDCTPGQLIIRTCLSKAFVYQLLKGERIPGRDIVLRISLALRADLEETQRLLTLAEKGVLYPKVKRDAAIICCVESHKSLEYTNHFLEEHGEKKLL